MAVFQHPWRNKRNTLLSIFIMILLAHDFSGKNRFLSVYRNQNRNMAIYNLQSWIKDINHQILHRAIVSAVYSYVWHCTNSRNATLYVTLWLLILHTIIGLLIYYLVIFRLMHREYLCLTCNRFSMSQEQFLHRMDGNAHYCSWQTIISLTLLIFRFLIWKLRVRLCNVLLSGVRAPQKIFGKEVLLFEKKIYQCFDILSRVSIFLIRSQHGK